VKCDNVVENYLLFVKIIFKGDMTQKEEIKKI
jgi:hypothetical protein